MLRILSFVTNPEILPVLDRVVNKQEGWTGRRASTLADANAVLIREPIDVILLGAGTGAAERESLTATITNSGLNTIIIDHYGGGSGLLYAEVMEAVGQRSQGSFHTSGEQRHWLAP